MNKKKQIFPCETKIQILKIVRETKKNCVCPWQKSSWQFCALVYVFVCYPCCIADFWTWKKFLFADKTIH